MWDSSQQARPSRHRQQTILRPRPFIVNPPENLLTRLIRDKFGIAAGDAQGRENCAALARARRQGIVMK
jgi:hypothetical protein